jgi:hypothetical protein
MTHGLLGRKSGGDVSIEGFSQLFGFGFEVLKIKAML